MSVARKIQSSGISDKELEYLRDINAIIGVSIDNIDKDVHNVEFFSEDTDSEYSSYEVCEIEFSYKGLSIWVDVKVSNESYQIEDVVVKDEDDVDCDSLCLLLNKHLSLHYNIESRDKYYSYKQRVEIIHDQRDPYDIAPKMPTGYKINPEYFNAINDICEEKKSSINLFLSKGSAGHQLKLKQGIKTRHVVRVVLPIIQDNAFSQVTRFSDKSAIAEFIQHNFKGDLKLRTLQNTISREF